MPQSKESQADLLGVLTASAARKLASASSYEKRVNEIPSGMRSPDVLPSLSARLRVVRGADVPLVDKRPLVYQRPYRR
jgi:hypothetical protein